MSFITTFDPNLYHSKKQMVFVIHLRTKSTVQNNQFIDEITITYIIFLGVYFVRGKIR